MYVLYNKNTYEKGGFNMELCIDGIQYAPSCNESLLKIIKK